MQTGLAELIGGLNLLGLGGLGVFTYYVIRGLRERIQALTSLAQEQLQTLDVVRTRAVELDQLRKDYRQALDDFQDLGHKLEERRKAVISDLELANKQKDEELARLKSLELEEIELKRKSLEKVGELEITLATTVTELQRQIKIVTPNTLDRPRLNQAYLAALSDLLVTGGPPKPSDSDSDIRRVTVHAKYPHPVAGPGLLAILAAAHKVSTALNRSPEADTENDSQTPTTED